MNTNTAPVLDPIGNQSVDELSTLTFTVTASDSDLPSDTLTFSLDAASIAAGMTIDSVTGTLAGHRLSLMEEVHLQSLLQSLILVQATL